MSAISVPVTLPLPGFVRADDFRLTEAAVVNVVAWLVLSVKYKRNLVWKSEMMAWCSLCYCTEHLYLSSFAAMTILGSLSRAHSSVSASIVLPLCKGLSFLLLTSQNRSVLRYQCKKQVIP